MRIFISYSKTRDEVISLEQDLEAMGHEVWFDHELTGGREWWDEILENIRACDLCILALSPHWLASYPCELEYQYSTALKKRLLPVMVETINPALLPSALSVIQMVDYRQQDKKALLTLNNALEKLPPSALLPNPLPPPPEAPLSPLTQQAELLRKPSLTQEEQMTLLVSLKLRLNEPKNVDGARELLTQLKGRTDLFANIAAELTALSGAVPIPTANTSSMPNVPKKTTFTTTKIPHLNTQGFTQVAAPDYQSASIEGAFHRRRTELRRLGIVDTVCVLASAPSSINEVFIKSYNEMVMNFARLYTNGVGGLPIGYGRMIIVYPVLIAEQFTSVPNSTMPLSDGQTSAFTFPVLMDLTTKNLTFYPFAIHGAMTANVANSMFTQLSDEARKLFKVD